MTRKQQIEKLLRQVPDEAMPQVIDFLRTLASKPRVSQKVKTRRQRTSAARRSFGLIPADAAMVRQVLAEDFYGLD